VPIYNGDRRRPLYYQFGPRKILGHYMIKNGGVDTLSESLESIYRMISDLHSDQNSRVLYEGKGLSDGSVRTIKLVQEGYPVTVVYLTTSPRQCIDSVRQRGHKISERSIRESFYKIERAVGLMVDAGVRVEKYSRGDALARVAQLMELDNV